MVGLDTSKPHLFRFGPFELNATSPELRKDGQPLRTPPQPLRVLALLVTHAGEIVSRAEIQHQVWGDDAHVDFELGLNYCMNRLRAALGDSAQNPRFIETIPRAGYRFIAPVDLAPPSRLMLAVLPLDNLSGDPSQEYLSEGLTEEVITELGRLKPERLGVIGRYSAAICKRSGKPLGEIAAELGVDHVLEGSVRRAGDRVRVSIQLIRVADQTHLWAETYERSCADVLAMEAELGQSVAGALAIELLPPHRGERKRGPAVEADVYDSYLKGRFHWNTWSVDSLQLACNCFQDAISRDSGFAPAYSGLADSLSMLGFFNLLRPHDVYPRALRIAAHAVELDGESAEAHASLAWAKCCYQWDWDVIGHEFERAITLNPNYMQAHAWHAFYLTIMGRKEEGLDEIRCARRLDPLSAVISADEACFRYFAGEYEESMEQCRRTITVNPTCGLAYHKLGLCYMAVGRIREAIAAFESASMHWQWHPTAMASLAAAWAAAGEKTKAQEILDQLEQIAKKRFVSPLDLALVYLSMGDIEHGISLLEDACEERDSRLPFVRIAPGMDQLSEHPRFRKILAQIRSGVRP